MSDRLKRLWTSLAGRKCPCCGVRDNKAGRYHAMRSAKAKLKAQDRKEFRNAS